MERFTINGIIHLRFIEKTSFSNIEVKYKGRARENTLEKSINHIPK